MAYKVSELEKKALEVIEKYRLFFIEDVICYLPCGKVTFYSFKLNEMNTIKEALDKNKTDVKLSLRNKWHKSDNPTTQIVLYKLLSTNEESDRINSQKSTVDVNLTSSEIPKISITFRDAD